MQEKFLYLLYIIHDQQSSFNYTYKNKILQTWYIYNMYKILENLATDGLGDQRKSQVM